MTRWTSERASWIVAWDHFRGHGFRFPYKNQGPSPFLGHKITLTQEIVGSRIHLPISGGPKVAIIREIDDLPQAFALRIDVFSGAGLVSREIRIFGPLKRRRWIAFYTTLGFLSCILSARRWEAYFHRLNRVLGIHLHTPAGVLIWRPFWPEGDFQVFR